MKRIPIIGLILFLLMGCELGHSPDSIKNQMQSEAYCSAECKQVNRDMDKDKSYGFLTACVCSELKK